ncbi:MAG: aldolase/citrate lyase family protein [Granulosicoccus sp.]
MFRLTNALDQNTIVVSAWCGITDPHYLEGVCAHCFDTIVLDMQHGFFDEHSIQAAISTVVNSGKAPIVRVPVGRWDTASRVMDFGALGVIAPMINDAQAAQSFAAAMKYVPAGERSFGPHHAAAVYAVDVAAYLDGIDANSIALAMIETRQAYENLDAILAVSGVDGILIGPGDLSISLRQNRHPDIYGPDSIDIVKDIIGRTAGAGKKSAVFTTGPELANSLAKIGPDIITIGDDQCYISNGVRPQLEGLNFR